MPRASAGSRFRSSISSRKARSIGLRDSYVRFLKAASLASALSLDAKEIAYLAYDPSRAIATSAKDKTVAGSVTLHPASMANIVVGSRLQIDAGAAQEVGGSHRRRNGKLHRGDDQAHDGSVSAFPIVSAPSPDVGRGWLNCCRARPIPMAWGAPIRAVRTAHGCVRPCRRCSTSRG